MSNDRLLPSREETQKIVTTKIFWKVSVVVASPTIKCLALVQICAAPARIEASVADLSQGQVL